MQLVLGPYDYYAIHYGYGYHSKCGERGSSNVRHSTRWALRLDRPDGMRFASDEDAARIRRRARGRSSRAAQYDLTNDPLAWCTDAGVDVPCADGCRSDARFPEQRHAVRRSPRQLSRPIWAAICAARTIRRISIGGEYLSRAQRGDPGAIAPLTPVTLAQDRHAWDQLDAGLFSDAAWRFNPRVLDTLTYSEVSIPLMSANWAYDPTPHHGVSILGAVGEAQRSALAELFSPVRLQRIDEFSLRYAPGKTMTLTDLFDWTRAGIFGDIARGTMTREAAGTAQSAKRCPRRLLGHDGRRAAVPRTPGRRTGARAFATRRSPA